MKRIFKDLGMLGIENGEQLANEKGKNGGVLVVQAMNRNGPYKAKKKNICRIERYKNEVSKTFEILRVCYFSLSPPPSKWQKNIELYICIFARALCFLQRTTRRF